MSDMETYWLREAIGRTRDSGDKDGATRADEELDCLRARVAELEKHAARYLYLRDDGDGFEITMREVNEDGGETWYGGVPAAELDAALDAALSQQEGEG